MNVGGDPGMANAQTLEPVPLAALPPTVAPSLGQPLQMEGIWTRGGVQEKGPSLARGILAGCVAALAGAVAWALIAVVSGYQIGFAAMGVGFLVGWAVRRFGRGRTRAYGAAGALLSLAGIILGNVLTLVGYLTKDQAVPLFTSVGLVATHAGPTFDYLKATFSGISLLFYAIAVYEGYRFAVLAPKPKAATATLPAATSLPQAPPAETPPTVEP
jgi:hypothetical protein